MVKLKIPVNKTEELVIVSHKGMLNIEKYEGDQRVEARLKDIEAIIDTLMYLDRIQWRIDKEYRDKAIKAEIPIDKTKDLIFILHHNGMLVMKVDDSQTIEFQEKDIPRVIDALKFVNAQEQKFPV